MTKIICQNLMKYYTRDTKKCILTKFDFEMRQLVAVGAILLILVNSEISVKYIISKTTVKPVDCTKIRDAYEPVLSKWLEADFNIQKHPKTIKVQISLFFLLWCPRL